MSSSHESSSKPSLLLALVSLCIVHRFEPSWLAVGVGDAARKAGESAERISRLATACIGAFQKAISLLTRRGRPPRDEGRDERDAELLEAREMLAVTTSMLSLVPPRVRGFRDAAVGAWQRIRATTSVTQKRFCEALALPERTLREWMRGQKSIQKKQDGSPTTNRPRRKKRMRRGRFGFDVTLPGTQYAADTTDVSAFGVPLKLVAAQDIGGRDEALFDSVIVDERESAAHVAEVLKAALSGHEGAQVLTDQGTPYMADATRNAMEELDVEHAPQKEGDPIGKATVERAFGSAKSIARPLLSMTNRVAEAVPALRDAELAKAFTRLCIAMILRAWQQGARAARAALRARGHVTPQVLAQLSEASRERARARERSARLLLAHIHDIYEFERPVHSFVEAWKAYPLRVLREAERAFRAQLHRDDLRSRAAYFAAIVRRVYDEHKRARARRQRDGADFERQRVEMEQRGAIEANRAAVPAMAMREALELVAIQWRPDARALLYGGEGLGLGRLRAALRRLFEIHPRELAMDIADGVLHRFRLVHADALGPGGIASLTSVARREILAAKARCTPCTSTKDPTILSHTGLEQRPMTSEVLRS